MLVSGRFVGIFVGASRYQQTRIPINAADRCPYPQRQAAGKGAEIGRWRRVSPYHQVVRLQAGRLAGIMKIDPEASVLERDILPSTHIGIAPYRGVDHPVSGQRSDKRVHEE